MKFSYISSVLVISTMLGAALGEQILFCWSGNVGLWILSALLTWLIIVMLVRAGGNQRPSE